MVCFVCVVLSRFHSCSFVLRSFAAFWQFLCFVLSCVVFVVLFLFCLALFSLELLCFVVFCVVLACFGFMISVLFCRVFLCCLVVWCCVPFLFFSFVLVCAVQT